MSTLIVESRTPVTLIGGGDVAVGDLDAALALAPTLVAADGGAVLAMAAGHVPQAVIGDFDSLPKALRAQLGPQSLFCIAEQDSTDFDKALRSIGAPVILAVGFLGARVDHQLAAFNALVQPFGQRCILLGQHELIFHLPPEITVPTQAGDVVSLFPMQAVSGCSTGLEWPIDGLKMSPSGRIGTSNRASGELRLMMDGPGALGIVPRRYLAPLMQALALAPPW